MAKIEYYSDLDLSLNEMKNFVVDKVTTLPQTDLAVGRMVQKDGKIYICQNTTYDASTTWKELAQGGDVSGLGARVTTLESEVGIDSSGDATGSGLKKKVGDLETAVGSSGDSASASGSLYARIKTKQDTLTAGTGISIGTVSDVANTIYLPDQANVTAAEYGSGTSIPKLTVSKQGIVTKTDSVTVYPPTSAGTSGQVWRSQGAGVGAWTSIAASSMTASSNTSASQAEIPSSYAVQTAINTAVTGAYKVKGSKTVAQLNGTGEGAVTSKVQGDVYNVLDSGTLTVSGQTSTAVSAGDNVVWDGTNWDKLASTVTIDYPVDGATIGGNAATVTNKKIVLGAAAGKGVDTSALTTSDDSTVPSSKLVSSQLAGKMAKFATAPTAANKVVVTVANDDDALGYLSAAVGDTNKPIYVKSDGTLSAISGNIGGATQPVYIADGVITAGTSIGTAGYKTAQEQGSATTVVVTSDDTKIPTSKAVYTALGTKVDANAALSSYGTAKCKITYDAKGLVTAGADLSASDIPTLTSGKISDFATAAKTAMSAQFVDTTLTAAMKSGETNNYVITTATKPYGVMVTKTADGTQVFVETVIGSTSITLKFSTAITAGDYTVSYILKTPSS